MQVSDLSTELGVPASAVLEACQRLDIDAGWVGAELSVNDAARLRADPSLAPDTPLPPTAAGSMPGFVEAQAGPAQPVRPAPPADPRPRRPTVDRGAGTAVGLVIVALVLLVVSNQLRNPFGVVGLWVVALGCLVACLVVGRRSWSRARVHPERYSGRWLAPLAMVVAVAGLVGLGAAAYTAVGDAPAEDGPAGIGELNAVQRARWGYQRTMLLQGNSWTQPVKVAGSCWFQSDRERDQDNRPAERIEVGNVTVSCGSKHTIEVLDAFNVNRDADAPYPGADALVALGQERCAAVLAEAREVLGDEADQLSMLVEIPTEQGWADADHSLACVAVTPERTSPVLSEG